MQILKQHKITVLFSSLIVFALALSIVGYTPICPTALAIIPTPAPTPAPSFLPDETSQYENQTLTPIDAYLRYLKAHPDVAIKGTQYIDNATYKLTITGLVNNPANYTYGEVVNLNLTLQVATLPCIEGWSVTLLWQGIPVTELLEHAGGISPDANTVIFYASDGYSSSLPLDYIKENNIMIAYKMNNVTLTPQTGWPFFLVAKDQYGYKWVEWITEINVSNDSNYRGYWESRGYPNNATVSGGGQDTSGSDVFVVLVFEVVVVVCIALFAVFVYRWSKTKDRFSVHKCTNKP
jgi:DMSO/TMAO reductase YedYZ molybdopterin-dependent catalytic subunit